MQGQRVTFLALMLVLSDGHDKLLRAWRYKGTDDAPHGRSVRLLLDTNSHPVPELPRAKGLNAIHVREPGIHHAKDSQILALAADEERILVSEDTDFGAPLTDSQAALPALVPPRPADPRTPMTTLVCSWRALCESTPRWSPKDPVTEPTRLRVRPLPDTREREP